MSRTGSTLRGLASDWQHCRRCHLGEHAVRHVLWEHILYYPDGEVISPREYTPTPIDSLFVGEAPGMSENVIGRPFIGPAGNLLRSCLQKALFPEGTEIIDTRPWACTFSNLLSCRPFSGLPTGSENRAPAPAEVEACQPRLSTLVALLQPKLIISLGSIPDQYVPLTVQITGHTCFYKVLRHPSWVLRQRSDPQLAREVYVQSLQSAFALIEKENRKV